MHDRVQEAAYTLVPEEQRAPEHLRIGRILAGQIGSPQSEEAVFEIVGHFNRAAALLVSRLARASTGRLVRMKSITHLLIRYLPETSRASIAAVSAARRTSGKPRNAPRSHEIRRLPWPLPPFSPVDPQFHGYYSYRTRTRAPLEAVVIPLGPPHKCFVVASCAFRIKARSVAEYPSVIATTRSAPGKTGGLGAGMSK